jgi:hypothetical protein
MEPLEVILYLLIGVVLGIFATATMFNPSWHGDQPWHVRTTVSLVVLACLGAVVAASGLL